MVENSKAFVALKMAEFLFQQIQHDDTSANRGQVYRTKDEFFALYKECLHVVSTTETDHPSK
ncbi:hypothetical protein [Faucicola atlantae]|uniref:hypothetical protein n=1 Tax=Faucicola atlantae TaxID=34059 RepID=UPI0025B14854|nr:hypothetical protein [Moraxella atlantae]